MGIGVQGVQSAGFGGVERRGSPTLAGMIPDSKIQRVKQEDPSVYTDRQGNMNFSGGRGIQSEAPTQKPTNPLDLQHNQLKGKHIDAIV